MTLESVSTESAVEQIILVPETSVHGSARLLPENHAGTRPFLNLLTYLEWTINCHLILYSVNFIVTLPYSL
jgi:hypothetical protein